MKERSLVFFTLLMQGSVGLCLMLQFMDMGNFLLVPERSMFFLACRILVFLMAFTGLTSSFFHLKVPLHAWRAFSNLKTSWLSREILFASIYTISVFAVAALQFSLVMAGFVVVVKWIALFAGLTMIFCMGSAYRLPTVKFWNSPQTIITFYNSALILGLTILLPLAFHYLEGTGNQQIAIYSGGILAVLILLNLLLSWNGFKRLLSETNETFIKIRKMFLFRACIAILAALVSTLYFFSGLQSANWLIWPVIATTLLSELSGRVLFYAAQVPYGVYLLNE